MRGRRFGYCDFRVGYCTVNPYRLVLLLICRDGWLQPASIRVTWDDVLEDVEFSCVEYTCLESANRSFQHIAGLPLE